MTGTSVAAAILAGGRARRYGGVVKSTLVLDGARIIGGAEAVNVLPRDSANKGVALQRAMTLFACTTAIYVGDDATDEDAFAAVPGDRLLSVRVGAVDTPTRARAYLAAQTDIDVFLRILVDLRTTQFTQRPASDV